MLSRPCKPEVWGVIIMNVSLRSLGVSAAALVVLGAPADAWRAKNMHDVFRVSEDVIEVVSQPGSGPGHFWCAIADFAIRQDRKPANMPIYLQAPIGPSVGKPGYKAVRFSYTDPGNAGERRKVFQNFYTVKEIGASRKAGAAIQQCANQLETPIDWPKR